MAKSNLIHIQKQLVDIVERRVRYQGYITFSNARKRYFNLHRLPLGDEFIEKVALDNGYSVETVEEFGKIIFLPGTGPVG